MLKQQENDLSEAFYGTHHYVLNTIDEVAYIQKQAQQQALTLHVGSQLDPGIRRKYRPNEDTLVVTQGTTPSDASHSTQNPFVLLLVADGMGGMAHGRKASRLAAHSLIDYVSTILSSQAIPAVSLPALLSAGVQYANHIVYENNQQQHTVMGTTMTAMLVIEKTAYIAHVGDSRLYLYCHASGLTQVTDDHSIVAHLVTTGVIKPEEIYTHPWRNQIYRCLGDKDEEEVDTFIVSLAPDDILLLCSDGLWEMVRDPQIAQLLTTPLPTPQDTADALIEAALANGGEDNVSAIVAQVSGI